nr:augmin complex subunit dgt3 [Vanessa tameamea]
MNCLNDMSDEEFIPFLDSLGVDTYKKSFEWMLNDADFSDVLRWIYKNLDQNNALSEREEYRYAELEAKGKLLPAHELEGKIVSIQNEFEGICLPGDQDTLEDIKLDIRMQKEKLMMLEKQEIILKELTAQNESTKQELTLELTKLNTALQQGAEDEKEAGVECIQLAEEEECIFNDVIHIIGDVLSIYGNCAVDKELAKRFFTFGPFESYRQSQALFKSHFDLYTSKKFNKKQNDSINEEDLRTALAEAKNMERWLSDAVCSYIETKGELCGEQAKLLLISNYNNVHPSQITVCAMEAQSAIELLEQEESILEQQLETAVKHYVDRRTRLAVEMTARSALAAREAAAAALGAARAWAGRALRADACAYGALRRELRAAEELLHFAAELRDHALSRAPAALRTKSMNAICAEQEAAEKELQSSNTLLATLISILGSEASNDASLPIKLYNELLNSIQELNDNINEGYKSKEADLTQIKSSAKPLRDFIWDGCTKQPNCYDRSVAAMSHSLREEMSAVDAKVVKTSGLFNSVKNSDKYNLRKFWQWFLTDQAKLLSTIKSVQRS